MRLSKRAWSLAKPSQTKSGKEGPAGLRTLNNLHIIRAQQENYPVKLWACIKNLFGPVFFKSQRTPHLPARAKKIKQCSAGIPKSCLATLWSQVSHPYHRSYPGSLPLSRYTSLKGKGSRPTLKTQSQINLSLKLFVSQADTCSPIDPSLCKLTKDAIFTL